MLAMATMRMARAAEPTATPPSALVRGITFTQRGEDGVCARVHPPRVLVGAHVPREIDEHTTAQH